MVFSLRSHDSHAPPPWLSALRKHSLLRGSTLISTKAHIQIQTDIISSLPCPLMRAIPIKVQEPLRSNIATLGLSASAAAMLAKLKVLLYRVCSRTFAAAQYSGL